jgi:hypothetical protein
MKKLEVSLLPVAEKAIGDSGFTIGNFPIEGYYYENELLTRYFLCIKTLQKEYTENPSPSIKKLHEFYSHPVFGLKQARKTAINSSDVYFHDLPPVTISPRVDLISIVCSKMNSNWTIDNIMKNIDKENLGQGIVGLAYLVDQYLKPSKIRFNPVSLCMARETTILSSWNRIVGRIIPKIEINWQVSPEIEEAGKKVIAGYYDLAEKNFSTWLPKKELTDEDIIGLIDDQIPLSRCVHLCTDLASGRTDKFYHWAINQTHLIDDNYKGYFVKEFWSPQIITTEQFIKYGQ